jgi:hypothetical protein
MSVRSSFATIRERLTVLAPQWSGWSRLAWCLRQKRALTGPRRAVVWGRSAELSWAMWGARHGFFEVARMDGLAYLRALTVASGVHPTVP